MYTISGQKKPHESQLLQLSYIRIYTTRRKTAILRLVVDLSLYYS